MLKLHWWLNLARSMKNISVRKWDSCVIVKKNQSTITRQSWANKNEEGSIYSVGHGQVGWLAALSKRIKESAQGLANYISFTYETVFTMFLFAITIEYFWELALSLSIVDRDYFTLSKKQFGILPYSIRNLNRYVLLASISRKWKRFSKSYQTF